MTEKQLDQNKDFLPKVFDQKKDSFCENEGREEMFGIVPRNP